MLPSIPKQWWIQGVDPSRANPSQDPLRTGDKATEVATWVAELW